MRRLGCHSGETIDRHGLADALEFCLALCHRVWRNNFRHIWRAINLFGDTNLVAVGKVLYPRCDIHRLAKIIEPLVERDCDRGSPMHADFQDEIALRAVLIELIHGLAHIKRCPHRIGRRRKRRHHRVTDRLGDGAIVLNSGVEKMLEMPLHLNVGVEVADPLVERGRTLEVGEYEGNIVDRNTLRRADHLGAEEVAKGLCHQQSLAGQGWREVKRWALKRRRRELQDAEYRWQLSSVANVEHDLAGCDVGCDGLAFVAVECNRHTRRYIRSACDREKELGVAVEILAQKRAFGGINLKSGRRTGLDAGKRPYQVLGGHPPWHAVGRDAARREFIMEEVIPGRKRVRLMEADATNSGRHRKRYRDVVVERDFVIALTKLAVELRVQFAQGSETLDNVGAHRTNRHPLHVE